MALHDVEVLAPQQVKVCRVLFAHFSRLHSSSEVYMMSSEKTTTHNVRRLPATPDNTSHTRKPSKSKKRGVKREQEMQYNLSYDFRGDSSRRHGMPVEPSISSLNARFLLSCDLPL